MQINIGFKGLDEFLKKVGMLEVQKTLDKSMKKSIFLLEGESKRVTPVDTGLLRNSYETKFSNLEGRLRNYREYAPYVENRVGFLQNTLDSNEGIVQSIFEDDLQKMLIDLTK